MNMDNLDQDTLDQNVLEFSRPRQRGWWSRNWLWFVPTLLLTLVVLCAATLYWWFFIRIYHLDVCRSAMQTIATDKGLQELLGQPIQTVKWPSQNAVPNARIEDSEIDILWHIEGPKDGAKAHLKSRRMGERWEPVILDVVLADGKKISIAEVGGNEAPPYESPKPEADEKPAANAPAPEINLVAPSDEQVPGAKSAK